MSFTTLADIREACAIDPVSHCWLWGRACCRDQPRIHAFDHDRGEKRVQVGTRAVWNIAFGESPGRYIVFRACQQKLCLNPAHLRRAATLAEVGQHIRRLGSRKGKATPAQIGNIRIAHKACGIEYAPDSVVLEIRASRETGRALSKRLGLSESVVSRIRRGESYRHVKPREYTLTPPSQWGTL